MSQRDQDFELSPWADLIARAPQILVGFSGGLDSTLLLKLLSQQIDPSRITAVHINHGLSVHADNWQALVEDYSKQLGVNFYTQKVHVKSSGQGFEAAAREKRYAVFESLIKPDGLLFLAHHADDQAETVLYRLLRGSGPKGLSAMANCRPIGAGSLIRPLLAWNKSQILACANRLNIAWAEDESNQDNGFDRNYLRNKVFPEISKRWPDYTQSLQQSADLCYQSEQLAEEMAADDLVYLGQREERDGYSIAIEIFKSLSTLRQRNVLRHWALQKQAPLPTGKIIDEVLKSVVNARDDAAPVVIWQSMQWTRFQGRLYLLKPQKAQKAQKAQEGKFNQKQQAEWSMQAPLVLADNSVLHCQPVTGSGIKANIGPLVIRYRQGGERCKPFGRDHSNSLKKLLQEYAVPPWYRDRVPLLYSDNTLVAVADLWVCDGWNAETDEPGLKINWQVNHVEDV